MGGQDLGFDLVERDVRAGWRLDAVLHNDTVTRHQGYDMG